MGISITTALIARPHGKINLSILKAIIGVRDTSKFKFPKDLDLEMSWNYQSGFKTIDGESAPSHFLNLGARKNYSKVKG